MTIYFAYYNNFPIGEIFNLYTNYSLGKWLGMINEFPNHFQWLSIVLCQQCENSKQIFCLMPEKHPNFLNWSPTLRQIWLKFFQIPFWPPTVLSRVLILLQFFLFCFVYLCLFIIFRSESWCATLTHFSLTHIAATLV